MWKGKKKRKSRVPCIKGRKNGKLGDHVKRKEEMEKYGIIRTEKKNGKLGYHIKRNAESEK